ncbi:MAG: DUF2232 domain-containing protein [Xanthomonadaceae bacterium]|nr:DUF2232 domain-containing protein [Xanthomonadaceae bacterium]
MSSFFFLSALFSVFAPLPLLIFYLRSSLPLLIAAIVSNTIVVGLLSGLWSAALFAVLVGITTMAIAYGMVQKRLSLEKTIGYALILIIGILGGLSYAMLVEKDSTWVMSIRETFYEVSKQVHELAQKSGGEWVDIPLGDFQKDLLSEVPASFAIVVLIVMWINVSILLSLNPRNIRKWLGMDARYFRRWRAPEFLVWPTILFGAASIWGQGWVGSFSIGILKFLLTIYALQGISVLAFFLDRLKIFGFLRSLIYLAVLLAMSPLIVGVGFFDLWFDFRSKFRQT